MRDKGEARKEGKGEGGRGRVRKEGGGRGSVRLQGFIQDFF